jgi:putative spermidine/putrescine transport system permease protein
MGATADRRRALASWLLVLPLLLPLVVLFLAPLARILWISVSDPEPGLGNYQRLLVSEPLQRVLFSTARICLVTTALALLLGYLIAYVMTQAGPRQRLWITGFVLVPFWISVLARAFSWVTLLRAEGIINSALMSWGVISEPLPLLRNEFAVVLGMVHYMVPYAVLPLYSNMRGINRRLTDASRSLGASPFTAFRTVFLPLSAPGIAASGVLVFIFSMGFFVTPAILGGGRVVMIAEYVSIQILQTVRWGIGTMMASVLLLATVVLLAAMSRVVDIRQLFGAK